MRKIIIIAESILDTVYENGQPVRSFVGGRIPCAAASLAQAGAATFMVSECTTDVVGDIVVDFLSSHGVDVKSIDRYPDGATAFSAIFKKEGNVAGIINYGSYPQDRFKVIWPRIDKDDIVIFGSLYSVDEAQREALFEIVSYAVERKAIIVYLPGFQHGINFRITRVMPNILENLEVSNIVITQEQDINTIFPGESSEAVYHNHVEFYCDSYLHLRHDQVVEHYHGGNCVAYEPVGREQEPNWLGWQAGFTAGLVYALLAQNVTRDAIATLTEDEWKRLVDEALQWAHASTGAENCVSREFAATRKPALERGLQAYDSMQKEQ